MNYSTTTLISLARKKMLEESTEVLEDATLVTYAQFTYADIVMAMRDQAKIKTAVVAFSSGVGPFPSDFGALYGNAYANSSSIFPEVSIADFTRELLEQSIVVDGGQFKIYPSTTATVNIKYYPSFADITQSVDPSIDSFFQELIIYGIMMRAYEDLQDEAMSAYYEQKFKTKLADKTAMFNDFKSNSQEGGQMFTNQRLI